jgi:hypothetical protein
MCQMNVVLVVSQYFEIHAALTHQMEQNYCIFCWQYNVHDCMTIFRDKDDDFTPTLEYELNHA